MGGNNDNNNNNNSSYNYNGLKNKQLNNRQRRRSTEILVPSSSNNGAVSLLDSMIVAGSSLSIIGSFIWTPYLVYCVWKRYRRIPKNNIRKRTIYGILILAGTALVIAGPHRSPKFGEKVLKVRKWFLWKSWFKYLALEVISSTTSTKSSSNNSSSSSRKTSFSSSSSSSSPSSSTTTSQLSPLSSSASSHHHSSIQQKEQQQRKQQQKKKSSDAVFPSSSPPSLSTSSSIMPSSFDIQKDQAIFAIVPHAIFPFALAFAALPEQAQKAFGVFRPIVATATGLFPFVRDFLSMIRAVDASRAAVDSALGDGSRVGLSPGGIAEMFEGYPKPLSHPDDEYAIIRKGILRLAMKYNVPVIPVYCFGATKLFKRAPLPSIVETVSLALRISIVFFYGQFGLPVPFSQKLLYVMGDPIFPPRKRQSITTHDANNSNSSAEQEHNAIEEMETQFCQELLRIFNQHKESYGWGHKTLIPIKL